MLIALQILAFLLSIGQLAKIYQALNWLKTKDLPETLRNDVKTRILNSLMIFGCSVFVLAATILVN